MYVFCCVWHYTLEVHVDTMCTMGLAHLYLITSNLQLFYLKKPNPQMCTLVYFSRISNRDITCMYYSQRDDLPIYILCVHERHHIYTSTRYLSSSAFSWSFSLFNMLVSTNTKGQAKTDTLQISLHFLNTMHTALPLLI